MKRMIASMALVTILALGASTGNAESGEDNRSHPWSKCHWSFALDNDVLSSDQNYTSGVLLARNCNNDTFFSSTPLRKGYRDQLDRISAHFGVSDIQKRAYSRFGGFSLFTPNDLTVADPEEFDGRPYASLLIYGDGILHVNRAGTKAIKHELQIGILGHPIGGAVQAALHDLISAEDPRGWPTQISRGGELVFAYGLQKKKLLCVASEPDGQGLCGNGDFDITANWSMSLGYYTGLKTGFAGRFGLGKKLSSPFWGDSGSSIANLVTQSLSAPIHIQNFQSSGAGVGSKDRQSSIKGNDEFYFFATGGVEFVLYSAVLQGQFRESEYKIGSSDVTRVVPFGSVGFVKRFGSHRIEVSQNIRGPEIDDGKSHTWGSLSVGWMF